MFTLLPVIELSLRINEQRSGELSLLLVQWRICQVFRAEINNRIDGGRIRKRRDTANGYGLKTQSSVVAKSGSLFGHIRCHSSYFLNLFFSIPPSHFLIRVRLITARCGVWQGICDIIPQIKLIVLSRTIPSILLVSFARVFDRTSRLNVL